MSKGFAQYGYITPPFRCFAPRQVPKMAICAVDDGPRRPRNAGFRRSDAREDVPERFRHLLRLLESGEQADNLPDALLKEWRRRIRRHPLVGHRTTGCYIAVTDRDYARRSPQPRSKMSRLLIANLIVWTCLFGAGIGAVQVVRAPQEVAAAQDPVAAPRAGEVTWLSLDLPRREAFAEVTQRPLFSTTRRPPPEVAIAEPATELPAVMLTGITGRPGALRAIVVHPEEGIVHLERGAELAGWIVGDITLSGIEMRPRAGDADPVAIALGETATGREGAAPGAAPARAETGDDTGGFGGLGYD